MELERMWINQPSTLQPLRHLHGTNVLALKSEGSTSRVWFTSGDIISIEIPTNTLSKGWKHDKDRTDQST